jgi:hypothetical protein
MEFSHKTVCEELLLDLICYEMCCGRLSPEMEYLFEKHLEECQSCRAKTLGFRHMVEGDNIIRNFG